MFLVGYYKINNSNNPIYFTTWLIIVLRFWNNIFKIKISWNIGQRRKKWEPYLHKLRDHPGWLHLLEVVNTLLINYIEGSWSQTFIIGRKSWKWGSTPRSLPLLLFMTTGFGRCMQTILQTLITHFPTIIQPHDTFNLIKLLVFSFFQDNIANSIL